MVSFLSAAELSNVINILNDNNISISSLIISLLHHNAFEDHPLTQDLVQYLPDILDTFHTSLVTSRTIHQWAHGIIMSKYSQDIQDLAHKRNGWHFGALRTSEEQLKEFRIEDMAQNIARLAPDVWELVGLMLGGERDADAPLEPLSNVLEGSMEQTMDQDEQELWDQVDDVVEHGGTVTCPRNAKEKTERRNALIVIVRADSVKSYLYYIE